MPNHRSAEKRQRQNEKRRQRNAAFKARMRRIMRNARSAADQGAEDKDTLLVEAVRIVQKARSRKDPPLHGQPLRLSPDEAGLVS